MTKELFRLTSAAAAGAALSLGILGTVGTLGAPYGFLAFGLASVGLVLAIVASGLRGDQR